MSTSNRSSETQIELEEFFHKFKGRNQSFQRLCNMLAVDNATRFKRVGTFRHAYRILTIEEIQFEYAVSKRTAIDYNNMLKFIHLFFRFLKERKYRIYKEGFSLVDVTHTKDKELKELVNVNT